MKHTKSISFLILVATLFFYLGEGDVFAQTNIARGKTAKQSSTAYGGEANRGVDGNTDGNYGSNSVTHTDDRNDRNQWWEVDLGKSYNIASIKIHNRTDCCADRLKDIYILVSETPIQSTSWQDQALSAYYGYNETYTPGPVVHTKNAKGRYVRIFRQAGAPLSLAEVEVFEGIATENIKAFVWYNETTKPSSALSAGYQYNSVGGAITGERIGQGHYNVIFPNMAKHYDGVCHVTAYAGNHSAQVEQWNASGNDLHVKVRVFDAKGAPTDGRFSAIFYKETRPNVNSAYLWASAEGKPNHKYQYNGKGAISMTKTGTGVYQVTFEGIQMTSGEGRGGNVIATPYGADARRVQVVSWLNRGANTVVTLNTYDFNGEPADTRFVVSYNSDWTNQAAYVWGNAATKTTQYEADKSYQMNNVSTAENMVTRLGAGSYKVTLPGIKNANASNAIATAYGNNKAYATIVRWSANSETKGTDVYVNTYAPDGQPADSQFSLFYTTNSPVE